MVFKTYSTLKIFKKGAICGGDSGGPLICEEDGKAVLHGVVSFNEFGSCEISEVGFYANVSESLQFIKGVLVRIKPSTVFIQIETDLLLFQFKISPGFF